LLTGKREFPTNRAELLERIRAQTEPWNFIIIGGGATGVGVAVDAATRGYRTLLLEQHDFGKGTSSRSTKLVHGGVRYLEQGNLSLVMEALKERGILRRNAPHLVRELAFVVPTYQWWETPFYGIGLKIYQLLAGKHGFGPSQFLSRKETLERLPNINSHGLRGGVLYSDGQFDDARLLINLVTTAVEQGATPLNYVRVTGLTKSRAGKIDGVTARDTETGEEFAIRGKVVINATGPFSDALRRTAEPNLEAMIAPSQGAHVVLNGSFLAGETALIVPRTSDGRVMFAIPWHGHTLLGTTDTPVKNVALEPVALEEEIAFLLKTASLYLAKKPARRDVLSVFAGIRPLVKAGRKENTAALSREHTIRTDASGLMTIAGGKWTTYRSMAEDCVKQAAKAANLSPRQCATKDLRIHGHAPRNLPFRALAIYGSDAPFIQKIIAADRAMGEPLHPGLPYCGAEIVWAVRCEFARTVEDALARRTRALFLNAEAAEQMAPRVAQILAHELGRDERWQEIQLAEFRALAQNYRVQ
jgi:glycerol-3-phosphate dehydrogenase